MNRIKPFAIMSMLLLAAMGAQAAPSTDPSPESDLGKAVREKLERLPYYGVFDLLSYQVNPDGKVELSGFVFRDLLKKEAEQAVLKVPGVKEVQNRIEDLDWGVQDDEIRAKVYLTIYRDTFLSRYGTPTDMALANGFGYGPRGRFGIFGPLGIGNPGFPGFNPAGDYAIHILVTNGEVILAGTVDSEGDKILAGLKARGVFPVKKVFNELSVKGAKPEPTTPAPLTKRGIVADDAL